MHYALCFWANLVGWVHRICSTRDSRGSSEVFNDLYYRLLPAVGSLNEAVIPPCLLNGKNYEGVYDPLSFNGHYVCEDNCPWLFCQSIVILNILNNCVNPQPDRETVRVTIYVNDFGAFIMVDILYIIDEHESKDILVVGPITCYTVGECEKCGCEGDNIETHDEQDVYPSMAALIKKLKFAWPSLPSDESEFLRCYFENFPTFVSGGIPDASDIREEERGRAEAAWRLCRPVSFFGRTADSTLLWPVGGENVVTPAMEELVRLLAVVLHEDDRPSFYESMKAGKKIRESVVRV